MGVLEVRLSEYRGAWVTEVSFAHAIGGSHGAFIQPT